MSDRDEVERWEPRPVPPTTPETAPYWAGCAAGELRLSECGDCGLVFHYPRSRCPACSAANTHWVTAAGSGTVYSYATMDEMEDWPEAALPLILAYVELKEGPRLMTNIVDCDPESVAIGARVTVRFVPTADDDIAVPVFTIEEASGGD